jgi:hypothetical protein
MRTALFRAITQRIVIIPCRRFGTSCRSHFQVSGILDFLDSCLLKMGPTGCLETSPRNYHYTLRNSPEERSYDVIYLLTAIG